MRNTLLSSTPDLFYFPPQMQGGGVVVCLARRWPRVGSIWDAVRRSRAAPAPLILPCDLPELEQAGEPSPGRTERISFDPLSEPSLPGSKQAAPSPALEVNRFSCTAKRQLPAGPGLGWADPSRLLFGVLLEKVTRPA